MTGDDAHRDLLEPRGLAEFDERVDTALARHGEIERDEIGFEGLGLGDALVAIGGLLDLCAGILEDGDQEGPDVLFIVDDEDLAAGQWRLRRDGGAAAFSSAGSGTPAARASAHRQAGSS